MSKHTRGPWRASNDNALDSWVVYPPRSNDPLPETEANARLQAAAPDLLEVCEVIAALACNLPEWFFEEREWSDGVYSCNDKVEAAILKARGSDK